MVLRNVFFALVCLSCAGTAIAAEAKKPADPLAARANDARGGIDDVVQFDAPQIYQSLPPNKSLLTSPRFCVVDDFNGKEWKSRLNSYWRLENAKAGEVTMELAKEDARGLRPGHSLKMDFDMKDRQQFALYTSLERLDMSQARFLAIKCRLEPKAKTKFEGRIRVSLTDWTGRSVTRDITDACVDAGQWKDAVLPVEFFKGLDFDQLSRIAFTAIGRGKRSRASLWLDEIAFFGNNKVGFESVLDNLKGFPRVVKDYEGKKQLLATRNDDKFLDLIGRSTWRFFNEAADKNSNLVLDHVKVGDSPMAGVYTSPTNIAMDLMGTVAALELGYIKKPEAEKRVGEILDVLQKLKRWNGFFYNFYETNKLSVSREFVSSVDNAWLAAAMIVARQAFPGHVARESGKILDEMNFGEFLDPDTSHIAIGYDMKRKGLTPYHYGMLVTEARTMSFIGIGKGDLPKIIGGICSERRRKPGFGRHKNPWEPGRRGKAWGISRAITLWIPKRLFRAGAGLFLNFLCPRSLFRRAGLRLKASSQTTGSLPRSTGIMPLKKKGIRSGGFRRQPLQAAGSGFMGNTVSGSWERRAIRTKALSPLTSVFSRWKPFRRMP